MQGVTKIWKTTIGKLAVLGGGGVAALLSLCFVCTVCGTVFRDSKPETDGPVIQELASFPTEASAPELTATPEPSPVLELSITSTPFDNAPDPTVAPEIVNTPAPEEEDSIPVVTAEDSNVNMRSGPGLDYEVVGSLPAGQSLEVVGRNSDSSWWQVSAPDGLCWIAASVVKSSNTDDTIPVVDPPSLPVEPTPSRIFSETPPITTEPPPQGLEPPASTDPKFTNEEVDPPWWPCEQNQIKGNRNSEKYHTPTGQFYAKTFEDVQCFATAKEAEDAGFVALKR